MRTDNTQNLDLVFGNFSLEIFSQKHKILSNEEKPDPAAINKNLRAMIQGILSKHRSVSFDLKVREAAYIMVSLADEIFLNTVWEGQDFWESHMLEMHFFDSQIAGEKFFSNLDTIIDNDNIEDIPLAELYMKALSLGFKGKYRGAEDSEREINIYRRRIFNFVEKHDKSVNMSGHHIFSEDYQHTLPALRRQLLPDASMVTYLSVVFVLIFLALGTIIWIFETQPLYRELREISHMILRT